MVIWCGSNTNTHGMVKDPSIKIIAVNLIKAGTLNYNIFKTRCSGCLCQSSPDCEIATFFSSHIFLFLFKIFKYYLFIIFFYYGDNG